MAGRKDRLLALAAFIVAFLASTVQSPDPCCLRVTPYHIQAIAQRMAQRFQTLEYRAQDLRGVFASFQAVHGNVSHRLRYLESEHAHLSEVVSRLDSRLHMLEEERKLEEYRKKVGYYRGQRAPRAVVLTVSDNKNEPIHSEEYSFVPRPRRAKFFPETTVHKNHVSTIKAKKRMIPYQAFPYVRFRREDASVLPPLRVHLDQTAEHPSNASSNEILPSPSTTISGTLENPTPAIGNSGSDEAESESKSSNVLPTEGAPPEESISSAEESPVFVAEATGAAENASVIMGSSGTTPTPLWRLEASADALLQAMSAGDEDDANALLLPPLPEGDESQVSHWSPANETDSLEQLYGGVPHATANAAAAAEVENCAGQANCTEAATEFTERSTQPTMAHTTTHSTADPENNLDVLFKSVEDLSNSHPTTNSIDNLNPSSTAVKTKTGCHASQGAPNQNVTTPNPINDTQSLLDIFATASGGGGTGNGSACEGSGCEATQQELSDAELQEALRELDSLLQRPPATAPPPDPEKLLLKRALKLALAALERTSDACLKLVNFTADAFEGLAAAEGMTATGEGLAAMDGDKETLAEGA